jgi:hypothetical protein
MENTLLKEAIADAKQIRNTALVNAKKALEEAFTPRIQSMISSKLNEMDEYSDDLDENYDSTEDLDENYDLDEMNSEDELEEEFNIDEILAEMDSEDEELEEAKDKSKDKKDDKKDKSKDKKEDDIKDLTMSELKDLIKDIVSQEIESEEAESFEDESSELEVDDMEMGGGEDAPMTDDTEINIDEILAEMDEIDENDELEEGKIAKFGTGKKAVAVSSKMGFKPVKKSMNEGKQLKEAMSTIQILREELNQLNLLNAKLIYVNKLFKNKNLNESQKIKVVHAFDKATTLKESKIVFESLQNTLSNATLSNKQTIKESLGFASKATGGAPKRSNGIVEDSVISRLQKLANIK